MRKIFHRLSGIILSTSLIFTGLNLTNITESFAEEPDNNSLVNNQEGYGLTASIDSSIFYTYNDMPIISWQINREIDRNKAIYIVNVDTEEVLDSFGGFTSLNGEYQTERFLTGGSKNYKLYIADWDYANEVSDLTNIVEESQIFSVSRGEWTGNAAIISGEGNEKNKITWSLNQEATNEHHLFLVDESNGQILNRVIAPDWYGYDINEIWNEQEYEYQYSDFNGNYKLVLALRDYNATNYNELLGIETEIDVTRKVVEPKWYTKLEYNVDPDDSTEMNFKITTNRSTTFEKAVYLVRTSDNSILNSFYSENDTFFTYAKTISNPSAEYKTYIADYSSSATNYSDLENIVASSDDGFPKFIASKQDYEPTADRYNGGFNLSSDDCQTHCYGDPINAYTGEYFENELELSVDSISPLALVRSYSTHNKDNLGPFGLGSTHNYNMKIIGDLDTLNNSDNIRVVQENGSIIDFSKTVENGISTYITSDDTLAGLTYSGNQYVLTRKSSGEKFFFNSNGQLTKTSNLLNNKTSLTYTNGKITKAISDDGKYIQINYNSNNLINSITDGYRTNSYTYDSQKRLTEISSYETSNTKRYNYDSNNRVKGIIHPNGGIYINTYDNENKVIEQKDPLNNITQFEYDQYSDTYQTKITMPDSTVNINTYNENGRLVSEIFDYDNERLEFTYEYGKNGRISATKDSNDNETRYIYDNRGNISTVIDPMKQTTKYTYNEFNQVVERINALGKKSINTYSSNGILLKNTDENGNTTQYTTDTQGRLTEIIRPNENGKTLPKKEKIIYDTNGFLVQNVSPEGSIQKITNNSIGLPTKIIDPLNNETIIEYDNHFNIVKQTYPNGTFEEYEYDNAGRLTKTIDTLGNETTYVYNAIDNLTSSTNVYGTTNYEYDGNQRLIKTIEPNQAITEYFYNSLGLLSEIKNPNGNIMSIEYDDNGNIVSETDYNGNTSEYIYDSNGRVVEAVNANYNSTYYKYDKLNRIIKIEQPNEYFEQYSYDNIGNIISINKNNADFSEYEYDKNRNQTKILYSNDSTEEKSYNADGSLISFTNKDGKTTSYAYNLNKQIVETMRPDNSKESVKYNSMGEITQISYDSWTTIDTEYEYNNLGQLTKATKGNNETNYAYDSIGQLTSRGPPSQQVDYSYDNYGRLNGIEYPHGLNIQYTYDLLNNIDTVLLNNTDKIVKYNYDANGNTIDETYGNGVNRTSEYDALNRLTNFNVQNSSTSLYDRSLSYDQTHLIQTIDTSIDNTQIESKSLTYDPLEQISETYDYETNEQADYEVDNYSNLLQSPLSNNTLSKNGQLISSQINNVNHSYSFDNRGNRLSKTNDNDPTDKTTYSWSNDNKLTNLTIDTDNSSTSVDYSYDASGLLNSRSKNGAKTDEYVWDTLSSIPLLLEDGNNEYIYGNDDSPIAQVDKNSGDISYLHGDERNSVVLATDSAGNSLLTREYDTYGNLTDETIINPPNAPPSDFDTNFAYAGEYLDDDTGLYNLRARWYEPLTGSFINQDPALIATGEAYSYASGNPLSFIDPLGLASIGSHPDSYGLFSMFAGAVDGVIGFPVVASVSNAIKPGTIDTVCDSQYQLGELLGMSLPGSGITKAGGTVVGTGINKGASALTKITTSPKWKIGDNIGMKTPSGKDPSFRTIRSRYWKNEAQEASQYLDTKGNATQLTANQLKREGLHGIDDSATIPWEKNNLDRMIKGKAPQRKHPLNTNRTETMELSHEGTPQRNATNVNHLTDVIQRWPEEHAAIDPYRRISPTYPF